MKVVLDDKYHTHTVCGNCKSTFAYAPTDAQEMYLSDDEYERQSEAFQRNGYEGPYLKKNGLYVTCPLCNAVIVVSPANVFCKVHH